MRTEAEIEKQIKKGEEFVEKHPFSMFGDDNRKGFNVFMKIIERYRKNSDLDALEDFIYDAYDDDALNNATAVLEWLRGDEDSVY